MPNTATRPATIREEVKATLKRLKAKDPGLRQLLKDAYGYAVFPSVGKAALVIGGAYGRGAVFEQGKLIGLATIGQTTIGVQVGGDTFSEIVLFEDEQALERFREGKLKFAANASAVIVKAGAQATNNYEKGVQTLAYSRGGMMLEAAIGGQKFRFTSLEDAEAEAEEAEDGAQQQDEDDRDDDDAGEEDEAGADSGIRGIATTVGGLVKRHPVATALIGTGIAAGAVLLTRMAKSSGGDGDQSDEGSDEDEDE
jgi:lipid-binding SYLF domain-containing protein